MHTVDNTEEPGRSDRPDPVSSAERLRRRLTRAGVAAALAATVIGTTLAVRADPDPPARANEAKNLSCEPAVVPPDSGVAAGEPGALLPNTVSDTQSEVFTPGDIADADTSTTDLSLDPDPESEPDPEPEPAPAPVPAPASTVDETETPTTPPSERS